MKTIDMFRVGIPPSQPLFQEDIIIIITEKTKQQIRGKRFYWLDSNPKHVYDYHEQENMILI